MFKKILITLILTGFVPISANEQITSSVKKLVGLIRFKKSDQAIAMIDTKTFSQSLLKSHWDNIDKEDQIEFEEAMKNFIKKKSFPIALEYFDKIDINYGKPKMNGKLGEQPASILYKGSDKISFSWILNQVNGKYLISDFSTEGKSASETNRIKQFEPIFQKVNDDKKAIKEIIARVKKASE